MKNIFVLLFFFVAMTSMYAQAPGWKWAKRSGGSDWDQGFKIAMDTSGSTYSIGVFQSPTMTFGTYTINNAGSPGYDMFIVKHNAQGIAQWAQAVGGAQDDWLRGVAADPVGNMYAAGYYRSPSVSFGTQTVTNNSSTFAQICLAKYDPNGNAQWARSYGGTLDDDGMCVTADASGNVYIAGFFMSQTFSFGTYTVTNSSASNGDLFIVKHDSGGNVVWAKTAGGSGTENVNSLYVDASGNLYATGIFDSPTLTFGSTTLTNAGSGNQDIFTVKYDVSGNVLWAKRAGSTGADYCYDVVAAPGGIYIGGSFLGTAQFGSLNITTGGNYDSFVARYDAAGNALWVRKAGGGGGEVSTGIASNSKGNVFAGGAFSSSNFSAGTYTVAYSGGSNNDVFVVKYDSSGTEGWAKGAGGIGNDAGNSIAVKGKEICVTGSIASYVANPAHFDTITIGTVGNNDFFIARMTDCEVSLQASQTNVSCYGGNNGTAAVAVSGATAPFTYAWSNGQSTSAIAGLYPATYTLTVTDAVGCAPKVTVTITQPGALGVVVGSVTSITCNGGNNGSATASVFGGTSPYSYAWSNGLTAAQASGLTAANYSVTVTDAGGCTATATVSIGQPSSGLLVVADSVHNVSACGSGNGAAYITTSGGTAPYSYLWSPSGATTQDATGLQAGLHHVNVNDAKGCAGSANSSVGNAGGFLVTLDTVHAVTCFGSNNGKVLITPVGGSLPYTFAWSNGASTEDLVLLAPGTYSVLASDANSCTFTLSANVSQSATSLTVTIQYIGNPCSGPNSGALDLSASGGTLPYSFLWSNSSSAEDISGLSTGNYSVTVTDQNACSVTASKSITQPALLTVSLITATPAGCNFQDGSILVNVNGGAPVYSYVWFPSGGPSSLAASLGSGNYSVTVHDANNCTSILAVALGDSCDYVWPGDANDDGLADNLDVLAIGVGYGKTGSVRAGASLNWIGQPCNDWVDTLTGNVNYKHVDCNGDGTIDASDTLAVVQNFGKLHNNKIGVFHPEATTDLYTKMILDSIGSGGGIVTVQIGLGTAAAPAANVYGAAFTVIFSDPTLVNPYSLSFKGQNSWLGTIGTDLMSVGFANSPSGTSDAVIVRNDHVNKSGNGIIATLKFTTTNSLFGTGNTAPLVVGITNATVISKNETTIPVNFISDTVFVKDSSNATAVPMHEDPSQLYIYPNPSAGEFTVYGLHPGGSAEIAITNVLGEVIFRKTVRSATERVSLTGQPQGIYFMNLEDGTGRIVRKIVIQ